MHIFSEWTKLQGKLITPDTWDYTTNTSTRPEWLIRGYTGHEHLTEFELINMNGRMYDPILGRMLSPDNFVQNPSSTQSYNRYSYCFNNPLKYTDPSGETFWHWAFGNNSVFQKIARPIIALSIVSGAVVGGWAFGTGLTADPTIGGTIGIVVFSVVGIIIVDQIWQQMDTW
ncbi:MAG: RHS repeat-associated core domain-containing protein [Bacteroidia bacterium]